MRDGSGASLTINKPKTKQQNLGINLEHGIIKTSCEGTNIFEEQGISIPQEQSIVSVNGKTMVGKSDKELLKYMEKALKKGACTLSLLSRANLRGPAGKHVSKPAAISEWEILKVLDVFEFL
eukprot:Pgem_evm1s8357